MHVHVCCFEYACTRHHCSMQNWSTKKYHNHKNYSVEYCIKTICILINTTGATTGAGTAYPSEASPEFTPGL